MPVNTGISASYRRPQTFHRFTYLLGGRLLSPLAQVIALIGTQKATGASSTATAEQVYDIDDVEQADGLFGKGSELALMCRKAIETASRLGAGPRIKAVGVLEPGGGTKNAQTLTVTGPATAAGNVVVRVAGRTYSVGVSSGDVAATIATAISDMLKAYAEELPVDISVAAAVVTLTHAHKGENGGDVAVSIDSVPAGVAVAVATSAAGAGVIDITNALDALAASEIDFIAISNHKAADVTDALAHTDAMWQPNLKKWRWLVMGERGTLGTATTLAAAANNRALLVVSCEASPSLPCELATAFAVAMCSRDRPNANFDGVKLPLFPPVAASAYTSTEVETALAGGVVPLTPDIDLSTKVVVDGILKIEKAITTKTTESSQPYEPLRELAVSRTGAYMARQIDIAYVQRFGPQANPDGVLLTDDTIDRVQDMIAALAAEAEEVDILKNVDEDLQELVVEEDGAAIGRLDIDFAYTVVGGMHQLACVHRVKVGG